MIENNRNSTFNKLRSEGKNVSSEGMGIFATKNQSAESRRNQREIYNRSQAKAMSKNQYEEVMDHLADADFDEDELEKTA